MRVAVMVWPEGPEALTRGRHSLTAEEVASNQRDRLMKAVADLASEVGCTGITADRLTERAGVSRSTVYELFDSKDACVLAASDHALGRLMPLFEAAAKADRPANVRLHGAIEMLVRFCTAHPQAARLCLVEVSGVGPEGAARRSEALGRMKGALEPVVREVAPGAPPLTTDLLVGGLYDIVSKRLRTGQAKKLPDLLPELRTLTDSLVGGGGRNDLP
jgi:AcrR family transcriptional regulator